MGPRTDVRPALVTAVPDRRWAGTETGRTALVPTMGALHRGHASLMRAARERADRVVVSIFVNPLQFGPAEDFSRYPRTLERDLAVCAEAGVDEVFHPDVASFYPAGFQTHIEVSRLSEGLCGAHRPGHFRGVATVVYRLFQLLQPDVALFGEKDFQQLRVIERMTQDLGLPVEVVGCPIVREADGLALSSRNAYLSAQERAQALGISKGLRAAQAAFAAGTRDAATLVGRCRTEVEQAGLRVEYVELRDPRTLAPVERADGDSRLLVAAHAGKTRLIDNAGVGA